MRRTGTAAVTSSIDSRLSLCTAATGVYSECYTGSNCPVTVVVLCVCLSVCLSATVLALQATRRLMSDTNRFSATRAGKITWRFC